MEIVRTSDEASIDTAARVLNAGGVVVIPTDTVYGLAAHPAFPDAVERLYTIKGRAAKKPIALLASDAASVRAFGYGVPERLVQLWPGALTVVTAQRVRTARSAVPTKSAGRGGTPLPPAESAHVGRGGTPLPPAEGFRVPDHDWTRELLRRCGGVLRVTSANLSGQRAATDAPQALADVGLSADLVVDDGVSPGGVPSTVVRVGDDGAIEVLREGNVKV